MQKNFSDLLKSLLIPRLSPVSDLMQLALFGKISVTILYSRYGRGDNNKESFRDQKWKRKEIRCSKAVGGEEQSLLWFLILEDIHIIMSDGNDYELVEDKCNWNVKLLKQQPF